MSITASQARRELLPLIERVNADRVPVEIVSRRGRAVLVAADDWEALQETAYLFASPANRRRLIEPMERSERGEFSAHGLAEA